MADWRQAGWIGRWVWGGLPVFALLAVGCASPGPPKAPSLQLPELVTKLEATRKAGVVELEFTVPERASDGLAYHGASVEARICRAVDAGACVPVAVLSSVALPVQAAGGSAGTATGAVSAALQAKLKDVLPDSLAVGPVRLLTYRVELSNEKGKTAGYGDAAFAAAGAGPTAVTGLRAEGSRRGVAVRWQAASGAGDVVLKRELVGGIPATADPGGKATGSVTGAGKHREHGQTARAKPAKGSQGEAKAQAGVVWLSTVPEADPLAAGAATPVAARTAANTANGVLDDGAATGGTYRYEAERRETVQLGGHLLVLHGELSAPVEVTLQAVYPPPAPTDLVGTLFPLPDGAGQAVDLIWTPADDPGTVGYRVWREAGGVRTVLTKELVKTPAFHDALPASLAGAESLTYGVVALDAKGMESPAVTTMVVVKR